MSEDGSRTRDGDQDDVHELQEMYDGECGAPEEKAYQCAGQEGIPPKRTKHEIQKLRDKGAIYSPD